MISYVAYRPTWFKAFFLFQKINTLSPAGGTSLSNKMLYGTKTWLRFKMSNSVNIILMNMIYLDRYKYKGPL